MTHILLQTRYCLVQYAKVPLKGRVFTLLAWFLPMFFPFVHPVYISACKSHFQGQKMNLKHGVRLIWGTQLQWKSMASNPWIFRQDYRCDLYASAPYMGRYTVAQHRKVDSRIPTWQARSTGFAQGLKKALNSTTCPKNALNLTWPWKSPKNTLNFGRGALKQCFSEIFDEVIQ